MQTTTNFGLRILEGSDLFRYADLQYNFDKWWDILRAMYPVGCIYETTASTNPLASIPNTTWEQIQGRFLLAADGVNYIAGATGGEATHVLTEQEMPAHTHGIPSHSHDVTLTFSVSTTDLSSHKHTISTTGYTVSKSTLTSSRGTDNSALTSSNGLIGIRNLNLTYDSDTSFKDHTHVLSNDISQNDTYSTIGNIDSFGNSNSHNNMPPYMVVNIWKRIS